ncbi:hypothetical protein ES703_76171 [subsurface metagenome]
MALRRVNEKEVNYYSVCFSSRSADSGRGRERYVVWRVSFRIAESGTKANRSNLGESGRDYR